MARQSPWLRKAADGKIFSAHAPLSWQQRDPGKQISLGLIPTGNGDHWTKALDNAPFRKEQHRAGAVLARSPLIPGCCIPSMFCNYS